ncbi:MAG: HDOD domain-containing protein [Rhodocyclaceae bacterium]
MAIDKALLTTLSEDEGKKVRRLVEKGIKLPPQPAVLEELHHLLTRGVSDVRILARSISQDPGMVASLFKVAQSSAFANLQPLESVEHILQAIGLKQTYNIVQAVSLANAVPAKHNAKAFEAFWVRSRAVAQMAMLIAEERVSVCNIFPDQAYLAGIFHDCGVPVLMQRFTTYCKAMHLDEPGGWTDLAEEDQRFNADHCVVGYLVGKHWKLPEFICDAIRYHHEIGSMGSHAARTMVAIVQLAIHLYYLDAHADNPEWEAVRDDVAEELGLHADALPEFIDEILERYHTEPH